MKTAALLACLFSAGALASFAVAKPSPVKGKHGKAVAAKTRKAKRSAGKVTLCHKTGSKRKAYVLVRVSGNSVKAHLKKGDVGPAADGSCPKPAGATTTTETTETDAEDTGTETEETTGADETTTEADEDSGAADSADGDDPGDADDASGADEVVDPDS